MGVLDFLMEFLSNVSHGSLFVPGVVLFLYLVSRYNDLIFVQMTAKFL